MWRRVPSGFRLVRPAFNPTDTNSTNFLGKTPSVQGFVVIFNASSAHLGSHSRSLPSAATQGLTGWLVFAVSSPVAIFLPPFSCVFSWPEVFLLHSMNIARLAIQYCSSYFGARFGHSKFHPFCALEHPMAKEVCAFKDFRRYLANDCNECGPSSVRYE